MTDNILIQIISIIVTYLIGSIPTGVIYSEIVHKQDVRQYGSGGSGGTNVGRNYGLLAAVIVIAFDVLKGWVPIALAKYYFLAPEWLVMAIGLASVVGHAYPIWASFKGGKIAATSIGVLLGFNFPLAIAAVLCVFLIMYLTSTVSVATMGGIWIGIIAIWFTESSWYYRIGFTILGILLIYRHRENIERLINGNENRINWGLNKPERD